MDPTAPAFYPRATPSQNYHDFWQLVKKPHAVKLDPSYSGKFLVFVDIRDLDKTWEKVSLLTLKGMLGPLSKTSTARPNPNALNEMTKVIIVYTEDFRDRDDVARIGWVLYEQGIFKDTSLNYKTNEATRAGLYSKTLGDPEYCKYLLEMNEFQNNNSQQKLTQYFKEKYSTIAEVDF